MTFSTQPNYDYFCRILGLSAAQMVVLQTAQEENKTQQEWQDVYQDPQHTSFEDLRRLRARQVLHDLWLLYVALNDQSNLNIYVLHNWMLLLIQLADPKGSLQLTKLLMSNRRHALNHRTQTIDKMLKHIGMALPWALVFFSIGTLVNASVKPEQAVTDNADELSDAAGLLPTVMRQLSQGERTLGSLNTIDLIGSSACSVLSSTEYYTQALSFSTGVSLSLTFLNMAFSSLGCVTEGLSWYKSRQYSKSIEASLAKYSSPQLLSTELAFDPDLKGKKVLQKMRVLETAKQHDHKKNAKLHGGLLVAALTVSIVINVVSFGAPLLLAITALAINAVIAVVKLCCGLKTSSLTLGLKSLQSTDQSPSLFERLHAVLEKKSLQLEFKKKITLPSGLFFKKTLSLQDYLESLLHSNPRKLTDIVTALECCDRTAFEKALSTHQQMAGWGETLGMKLYRQLVMPLNVESVLVRCVA